MTPIARPREDAAAERLYAEYSERLLAYCLRQLGSYSEAEDAVQITFLCALRALRRGVVPESESAWLYAIARNVCRWQRRTASRRPAAGALDVEVLAAAAESEDAELLSDLRAALDTLPERQRRALLLREWQGLSASEIADRLGLSAPATHALLTRARRSLAHALTAPRRAALGLASLVYELRPWLKSALGGTSTKVAAATVVAAGVGVGGVAVDASLGGERSARRPAAPPAFDLAAGQLGTAGRTPVGVLTSGADGRADRGSTPRGARASSAARGKAPASGAHAMVGRRRVPVGTAGGEPGPGSAPTSAPREQDAPVTDPLAVLPLEPPALPEVPTVDLPPVDVPPVDLPPLEVAPVDLPPTELPADVLPPVDLPPVDPPPVDVPPVDVPPVDVPPLPPLP